MQELEEQDNDADQSGLFVRLLAKDKQIAELTRLNRLLEQEKSSVECLLRVSSEQLRKLQEQINNSKKNNDQNMGNGDNRILQGQIEQQMVEKEQQERIKELTEQCMKLETSVMQAHEVIAYYQEAESTANAKQKQLKKTKKLLEKELEQAKEINQNLQEQFAVMKGEQQKQLEYGYEEKIEELQRKILEQVEEISKMQEDQKTELNKLHKEFEQAQHEVNKNQSEDAISLQEEIVQLQKVLVDLRQEHISVIEIKEELEKNVNYLKIDNITLKDRLKRMNGITGSSSNTNNNTHNSSFIQQYNIPPRSKPTHKRANSSSSQQLCLDNLSVVTPTQHFNSLSINQQNTSSSSVNTAATTIGLLGANRNSTGQIYPKMTQNNSGQRQIEQLQHLQQQTISESKNILTFAGNSYNNNNNSYGTISDQQQQLPLGIQIHCKPAGKNSNHGNFQQDISSSQWNSMYATIDQTQQLGELAHNNPRERSIDTCELSSILSKTIVSPLKGQLQNKQSDKLKDITKELNKEIGRLAEILNKGNDGLKNNWNQSITSVNMMLTKAEGECKKFNGISSFNENEGQLTQQQQQQQYPQQYIIFLSILESTRQLLSLLQFSLTKNSNNHDHSKNIYFNQTKHNQTLNLPSSQHLHHTPDQEIKHLLTELQELNGETYESSQLQQQQEQESNSSKNNISNYQLLSCLFSTLINLLNNPSSSHKGTDNTFNTNIADLKQLERQLPNSIQPYLQNLVNQIVNLKSRNQEIQRELTKLQLTNRNVRGIRGELKQ